MMMILSLGKYLAPRGPSKITASIALTLRHLLADSTPPVIKVKRPIRKRTQHKMLLSTRGATPNSNRSRSPIYSNVCLKRRGTHGVESAAPPYKRLRVGTRSMQNTVVICSHVHDHCPPNL